MNDKREQDLGHDGLVLWKLFVEASRKIWGSLFDQISDEVRSHLYDLFKAGHAAATAEGIPQSDGWVAIETGLPDDSGWYCVTTSDELNYDENTVENMFFHSSLDEWEINSNVRNVIAWQPLPAPYQRQSSEGDSK